MNHNLGRDLSRLVRQSDPRDPRAPWWLNWLMQLAVAGLTIWGLAAGADWFWQYWTGRTLGAVCTLVALLPFHWLEPAGMIVAFVGVVLALDSRRRTVGILWFILGTLLYSTRELLPAMGLASACA